MNDQSERTLKTIQHISNYDIRSKNPFTIHTVQYHHVQTVNMSLITINVSPLPFKFFTDNNDNLKS